MRRIHSSPLNIETIRVKEKYRFLLEEITMNTNLEPPILLPLRIESAYPTNQWDNTWYLARKRMLGPSLTSFMFTLLYQILPTSERLARILPTQSPLCYHCKDNGHGQILDTQKHTFLDCTSSSAASTVLLEGLQKIIRGIAPAPPQHRLPGGMKLPHSLSYCSLPFISVAT